MAYTEEQRAAARMLQDRYMYRVAAAWRHERQAAEERVRRVKSAEEERNAALKEIGVKVNDLGSLT